MNDGRSRLAFAVAAAFAGTGLTAGMPGVASAQQVTSITSGLEEVVVSAQRRDQVLQDVPITIQVVGSDMLNDIAAEDLGDLNGFVPGLVISSDSPTQPRLAIRGISTGDFGVGTDSAVGVYVDGVYSSRTGSSLLAFNDIERIEVLKGPLSVLYGSGSTGGIVNVITRRGRFTPEPSFNLSVNPTFESAAGGLSVYERAGWSNSRFYLTLSQSNRRYTDYRAADELRIGNSQFQDRQTQASLGLKITQHHTLEGRFQYFSALDAGLPGGDSFPQKAVVSYPTTSRTLSDITWTWRPSGVVRCSLATG